MESKLFSFKDMLNEELKDDSFKELFEEESLKIEIINEIIKIRKKRGITQKQLANLSGIKQSNISRLENGKVTPSLELIQKIMHSLGYKVRFSFEPEASLNTFSHDLNSNHA